MNPNKVLEIVFLDIEKKLDLEIQNHKKFCRLNEPDEYCRGLICAKKLALTLINQKYKNLTDKSLTNAKI